jgi:hypothetical protein
MGTLILNLILKELALSILATKDLQLGLFGGSLVLDPFVDRTAKQTLNQPLAGCGGV